MGKKLKNYESFGKCEETVEKILFRKNGTKIEKNVILEVFSKSN
jgi:hypothetical protein